MARWLNIGGTNRQEGEDWETLDVVEREGVDHVQNAGVLSAFAEGTFDGVYASHVLEHFSYRSLPAVLTEWCRVLKPGGKLYVSVPDLDTLCFLFLNPAAQVDELFHLMRMMYGGHVDASDIHTAGLNEAFLRHYFMLGGFAESERVVTFESFFDDTSRLQHRGQYISLNMIATKGMAPDE